jgi:hypothetical protein
VHWVKRARRAKGWFRGLLISGFGTIVTASILVALCVIKFFEGGWATIVVTAAVVVLAHLIRGHYDRTARRLERLNSEVAAIERDPPHPDCPPVAGRGRTAVLLCNGYNGLGVHTFLQIFRLFPGTFDRVVFVLVGTVDAGSFKGADELERLRVSTEEQAERYVSLARRSGIEAEAKTAIGHEVMEEIETLVEVALLQYPSAVVFAGQLAFQHETFWTRLLHNYVVFELQRVFCRRGVPYVIVPVSVD